MDTTVGSQIDERVTPKRIWVGAGYVYREPFDGGHEYIRADAAPNTRQRAEQAARRIYNEIDGVPDVPEMADIIAAEFDNSQ